MTVYIKNRCTISECVQNCDCVVREYRNNEDITDFNSSFGDPILTTSLESFEG